MGRPKKYVSEQILKQYNLELKLANNSSKNLFKDKSSKSTSCLMCQKRKTKCIKTTNKNSCLNCLKSVIKCIKPDIEDNNGNSTSTDIDLNSKDQYIRFLESKLCSLEESLTELDDLESASKNKETQSTFNFAKHQKFHKKIQKYKKISGFLQTSNCEYDSIVDKLYNDIKNFGNTDKTLNIMVTSRDQQQQKSDSNTHLQQYNKMDNQKSNNFSADIISARTLPPLFKKSSPMPINDLKRESISDTLTVQSFNSQILGSIDFSKCILAKYNLTDFLSYDPAFSFDEVLSCQFLEIYFTRLQFKYPILAKDEVFAFHSYYTELNGQPSSGGITKANNSFMFNFFSKYNMTNLINTWKNNGFAKDYHYCCSRSWLIFAISSCLHKTSGKYRGLPPNRYFSTAIRHLAKCQDNLDSWEKVEILSLSLQYIIRTDRDSIELYIILKDVIDISLNILRLHDLSDCVNNKELRNKKIRVFWSVYLLERMICNAVEKPFLINDDILPKDYPLFDLPIFEKGILIDDTSDNRSPDGKVHFINQVIKLRMLESKFAADLDLMNWKNNKNQLFESNLSGKNLNNHSGNNKTIEERKLELPKMEIYFKDLCDWRSNCQLKQFRAFETETLKLYYYRAVRLLIQPYLDLLKPHSKLFRECQAAAGQICQLYKIFHQKTVFGHSTSAVHTVFSAGLTLIYCLWLARNHDDQRRRKLGDSAKHTRPTLTGTLIASFDDLRACSVSLYVMAERSRFAVIYRDTFDQLMQCTIGNLIERSGPNSSELIPTKSISTERVSYRKNSRVIGNLAMPTTEEVDGDEEYEEEEEEEYEEGENKHSLHYSVSSPENEVSKSGIPAAINRHFGIKQEIEHSGFLQNMHVDTEEQKELKRRRGVLKKTMIPKPLSNLLDAYDSEKKRNNNDKNISNKKNFFRPLNNPEPNKPPVKAEYKESDHLKEQVNTDRFVSASAEKKGESSSSSSFGSPRYFVQKPLLNPTEEEWKNMELKALIKQQAGHQSLQASLTGVPSTINSEMIQNLDAWDFTIDASNSNNALFEMSKSQKLVTSPAFNFLQDASSNVGNNNSNNNNQGDSSNIQALWNSQQQQQQDLKNNNKKAKTKSPKFSAINENFTQPPIRNTPPSQQVQDYPFFNNLPNFANNNGQPLNRVNSQFLTNESNNINNSMNGYNNFNNRINTNHTSSFNEHISNPINQSTIQHMISNISQWTSAGFEDFFFAETQQQQQQQQQNQD